MCGKWLKEYPLKDKLEQNNKEDLKKVLRF